MITKPMIQQAVADIRSTVAGVRQASGPRAVLAAIPAVVRKVEEVGARLGLKGADKKALALDILFALLPPLPWWLPESVLRFYAGILIERAVSLIKRAGKGK